MSLHDIERRLFEVAGSMRNFADVADRCTVTEVVNGPPSIRTWAEMLDEIRGELAALAGGGEAKAWIWEHPTLPRFVTLADEPGAQQGAWKVTPLFANSADTVRVKGEPVAQLTTYEDTNSFSARMHDVVHDLPPGTYNLYLPTADAVQVTDEDVRWLEDNHEALIEAGGPTNNMRAIAVRRAINALSPGGSRE